MTATVLPFPRRPGHVPRCTVAPTLPVAFAGDWQAEHLPLIDAAMGLARADDDEFARRCRSIARANGPSFLADVAAQLDRITAHVADVVATLASTAARIREHMGGPQSQPA